MYEIWSGNSFFTSTSDYHEALKYEKLGYRIVLKRYR